MYLQVPSASSIQASNQTRVQVSPANEQPPIADSLMALLPNLLTHVGMSGYARNDYRRLFYPPPYRGMGCAGKDCGCDHCGMGDTTDAGVSADQLASIKDFFYQAGQDNASGPSVSPNLLMGLAGLGIGGLVYYMGGKQAKPRTRKRRA